MHLCVCGQDMWSDTLTMMLINYVLTFLQMAKCCHLVHYARVQQFLCLLENLISQYILSIRPQLQRKDNIKLITI